MAQPASLDRRWKAVRTSAGPRILTAALAIATVVVFVLADLSSVRPTDSPAWTPLALLIAFLAAEATHVHVEFRRQNNSISLSEIPLVVGLFLVSPLILLAVRFVAALVVSAGPAPTSGQDAVQPRACSRPRWRSRRRCSTR